MSGNAAIYIRVSTDDQAQSGLGLEAQEAACRRFAETQGLQVGRVFVESGVSRWTLPAERPAMAELLSGLKKGGVVVALKIDRIGDAGPLALFNHVLKRKGARLLLVNGDNSGSIESQLMNELMGVLASHECRQVSVRTRAAMAAKKARGERFTRKVYGHDFVEGRMVENPTEQAVIQRIRLEREEWQSSWQDIADSLNADSISPPSGSEWFPMTAMRIYKRTRSEFV